MEAQLIDSQQARQLVALRVRHAEAEACVTRLAELNAFLEKFEGFQSLDIMHRDGGVPRLDSPGWVQTGGVD